MIQTNSFHKVLIILLAVALLQVTLWPVYSLSGESGDPVKDTPVATPGDIVDGPLRISDQMAPPGWHLIRPVKLFDHENLWEQIDGRADFFLSYDMVRMTFAVYTDSSDSGMFINVSIYDMGNPTNAFGVFSAERQEEIHPVDLGRDGYRFGANLFIWNGPYYVRMITSKDSPELKEINLLLAEKLMVLLDDSGEPVRGLEMLPEKDRVSGSEQYYRNDAMGLDFMNDSFMARYRKKDVLITFFLTHKGHPVAAKDILDRYAAYAKKFGEGTREVTRSGMAITLCDMDGSYDALFQEDGMVAGVTSIEDRELAVDLAFEFWRDLSAMSLNVLKK